MGLLDVQWPPERESLTTRYAMAKRRAEDDEPRSVISTRNSAALLEGRDFLGKFEDVIHRLNGPSRRQSVNNFSEEFLMLEIAALPGPGYFNKDWYKTALEKRNKIRNRYISTYATETTRVMLRELASPQDSDYINANYVDGIPDEVSYIATQSPSPPTFAHFWQMVWEHQCTIVLMLTKLVENGVTKGEQYWPETPEFLGGAVSQVTETYGDYVVTQTPRPNKSYGGIKIRHMTVSKLGSPGTLEVAHIQYSKWPDHGVPRTPGPLLELLEIVARVSENTTGTHCHGEKPPVIVHCSAGIGRTGTYCAVDIGLRRFRAYYNVDPVEMQNLAARGLDPLEPSSVQNIVKVLKQQRYGMVQTWAQYRFCFTAIHEGVRRIIEREAASEEQETGIRRQLHEARLMSSESASAGLDAPRVKELVLQQDV